LNRLRGLSGFFVKVNNEKKESVGPEGCAADVKQLSMFRSVKQL